MTEKTEIKKEDISIVLCGQAGQGIQTVEKILVHNLKLSGYHVFATKEYMSRVRGGMNSTEIRISSHRVSAYTDRIDILVPFHKDALSHLKSRISSSTQILADKGHLDVPFTELALEIGGKIYLNILAAGVLLGLFSADKSSMFDFIQKMFHQKEETIIQNNRTAAGKGYEIGKNFLKTNKLDFNLNKDPKTKDEILVNGAEAVGLGALGGGCDFLSSYPMSPSTGVMVFLAHQTENFDIVVEQAEDEICAINMALGASYAGARAMVTTSGGGFALMTEGVSLAGMIETPIVIHVAQRPGPATGLPTRTEQADLELVLYSGQGEFPRIILAPGSLDDAFYLTQKAFNLADKFQVPVFILTDQYFVDSAYNTPPFDLDRIKLEQHIVKTTKDYRRYSLTDSGISPRGIPGFGDGLVGVDSDEHDEDAHITENLEIRTKMVDKRLKKLDAIKEETIPPILVGPEDYRFLVLGWGSSFPMIQEALSKMGRNDMALLHFIQIFPLSDKLPEYLKKAEKIILVEGNATGQFGKLIKLYAGIEIDEKILKYNGMPFSVEEIIEKIQVCLGSES
ncbi:MAG: 2-oxoacid:acceptor oxidoreductase subunit alpha [Candidatus Aminicenantes bacterium]|nr:2-oxoacid:acceptor oxidoreductase subunit alpha [Candidatus Aminicenantes bacterium]